MSRAGRPAADNAATAMLASVDGRTATPQKAAAAQIANVIAPVSPVSSDTRMTGMMMQVIESAPS